jgi:hypothetical protein
MKKSNAREQQSTSKENVSKPKKENRNRKLSIKTDVKAGRYSM